MSIQHFDKLSVKRQQIFLNNPEQFTCQEKVDGSNLFIGRTEGRMWVSRKSAANPIYMPEEWGNPFWVQNFKNAHKALLKLERAFISVLGEEFQMEAEILSKEYPNTIDYQHSENQIIIFKPEVDFLFKCRVDSLIPQTDDGTTMTAEYRPLDWVVTGVPSIPQSEWLHAVQVCSKPDPNRSTYERLIETLVRPRHSVFSDSPNSHVKIEGLVFRHTDGWMLKLVDREWFTKLNTDNYRFRKLLFRSPGAKGDSIMDVFSRDSMVDVEAAALAALTSVMNLEEEYERGEHILEECSWIHKRNLEAIYSVKHQMLELLSGR
jgi:hypothetical protein